MKLKLISDGFRRENIRLVNAETGELVHGVAKIEFMADAQSDISTMYKIHLYDVDVDLDVDSNDVILQKLVDLNK